MNKKDTIAFDWLKRYTGTEPEDYGEWILLTNFKIMLTSFRKNSMQKLMALVVR